MSAAAACSRIMHEPKFVFHFTQTSRLRAASGCGRYVYALMVLTKEKLNV